MPATIFNPLQAKEEAYMVVIFGMVEVIKQRVVLEPFPQHNADRTACRSGCQDSSGRRVVPEADMRCVKLENHSVTLVA
jgi:hypothetical protein